MIYSPEEDSYLIAKHIKEYAESAKKDKRCKKILDMGTGSGILSEEAMKYSDNVLAVDINPEAVVHVKKKGIKAIQSDLFSKVKGKFDLIIFNPPYLPEYDDEDLREDEESKRITTGGKYGHEILERFFSQAKKHLNESGKILIVFSNLTGKEKVNEIIKKNEFNFKQIDYEKLEMFEELYVYVVY